MKRTSCPSTARTTIAALFLIIGVFLSVFTFANLFRKKTPDPARSRRC